MLGNLVRRLIRDERGAALAEYAAIFLVLATAGTVILLTVGGILEAANGLRDVQMEGVLGTPEEIGGRVRVHRARAP
jgi:Flp pilus assembly pilin Flp